MGYDVPDQCERLAARGPSRVPRWPDCGAGVDRHAAIPNRPFPTWLGGNAFASPTRGRTSSRRRDGLRVRPAVVHEDVRRVQCQDDMILHVPGRSRRLALSLHCGTLKKKENFWDSECEINCQLITQVHVLQPTPQT